MELPDYNLTFVYIKGSNNILADAISRLKTLDIYRGPLENPKTSDTMNCMADVVTTDIQTLGTDILHPEQKKDINCRNLAAQSHHKNNNSFNPIIISADGFPQNQQYIHGLKDADPAPHFIVAVILQEFHN